MVEEAVCVLCSSSSTEELREDANFICKDCLANTFYGELSCINVGDEVGAIYTLTALVLELELRIKALEEENNA